MFRRVGDIKTQTRSKLVGIAFVAFLLVAFAAQAYALPPQALDHSNHDRHSQAPLTAGMTLHITGTGTAFKINNQTIHDSVSLNLTVTVDKNSPGRAKLTVTSGTIMIGTQTYTVVNGHGIINFHSDKILLHVHLKDSSGHSARLFLFGKASTIPKSLSVGSSFNADFKKPESKLAGKWFLEFSGATVTRIA